MTDRAEQMREQAAKAAEECAEFWESTRALPAVTAQERDWRSREALRVAAAIRDLPLPPREPVEEANGDLLAWALGESIRHARRFAEVCMETGEPQAAARLREYADVREERGVDWMRRTLAAERAVAEGGGDV